MEPLEFQPTSKTPYVLLDPGGTIKFRGRSIPEDVSVFYDQVLEWVKEYVESPPPHTIVDVEMEYLNSGTSKYILRILKLFKDIDNRDLDLKINWIYEEGDDDIMERGEYYASILDLKINFIEME